MRQSEIEYRRYLELYNAFMDRRFGSTEEALAAAAAASAQLVTYKVTADAEYRAAEAAYALTPEGIQEAIDIAAWKAYVASIE